ncbi:Ankyrin repeat-containing domain [Sesbania bispinosa]|nr:Ankyrin repeat-containing domain [Sesbania bispinosa]
MNSTNNERLQAATFQGDIDLLYILIQEDPYVLEHVDCIPFVETQLHVAALQGDIQFVIEVAWLKPYFAVTLNPQGWSTIHIALMLDQQRLVIFFIDINYNIVRVRVRGGKTPMHLATQTRSSFVGFFLNACLESIEDVTVEELVLTIKSPRLLVGRPSCLSGQPTFSEANKVVIKDFCPVSFSFRNCLCPV